MRYDQTFTKVGFQPPVAFTIVATMVLLLATLPFLQRRHYAVVASLVACAGLFVVMPIFPLNLLLSALIVMVGSVVQLLRTKSRLVKGMAMFSSVCLLQFLILSFGIARQDVSTMGHLVFLGERGAISKSDLNLTEYRFGDRTSWSADEGDDFVALLYEKDYYYSRGKVVTGRKVAEYLAQWSQRPVQIHEH